MVEMNKAKVLIVLVVSNVIVALALIGLEAALIYTASDIQQSVETVSNVQTSFNNLGMQLSTTTGDGDKTAATALIVIGSLTIVVNLMLLISYCVYRIYRKKDATKIQLTVKTSASVIIIGCIHIILVIPGSVYLDNMQSLQASKINQTAFLKSLQDGYKDDSFPSPGNAVSDTWNEIFIDFKCCAVHTVNSTTNDFDLTPWCTTSGSCQQTNSQIPKTCCKGVDKTNYASAPRACHEYVQDGYHEQGCVDVWPNVIGILTDKKKVVYSIGMTALVLQAISSLLCLSLALVMILKSKIP